MDFASAIPSSSISDACSIERTPPRSAILMPSAPCAVRRGVAVVALRLIDHCPHFFLGHFRSAGLGAGGENRASSDDLQKVCAILEKVARFSLGILRPHENTGAHVCRNDDIRREAGDFPASAGHGEICPGDCHARSHDHPRIDRIAQGDVAEGPESADVTHAGEPGVKRVMGMLGSEKSDVRFRMEQGFGRIVALLGIGQMGVHIDETRQHRIG